MDINKVKNIETFLKQLPKLNEKLEENIFYRGQSNIEYKLTPSVLRGNIKDNEHSIYNQIMTDCSHEFENCNSHNEILSKMQHYGVPTRLLDVTSNALVALYFSCDDVKNKDKDGVVYVLKTEKSKIKQFDSDAVAIISSLPRFNQEEKEKILNLALSYVKSNNTLEIFNENKIIKRLLHEIKKERPAFENIINPNDILTNYFFIPRKNNARIIRQSGAFIIFGLGNEEIEVDEYFNNNLVYNKSYKIIVDKNKKETIKKQLSLFGISKATLHHELYKVAEYIKEKYPM